MYHNVRVCGIRMMTVPDPVRGAMVELHGACHETSTLELDHCVAKVRPQPMRPVAREYDREALARDGHDLAGQPRMPGDAECELTGAFIFGERGVGHQISM